MNRMKQHLLPTLAIGLVLLGLGCVKDATPEDLTALVAQYQVNTLPTVVHYTGSDDTHDYFYLDVPLGRNQALRVPRAETMVTNRFKATRKRETWEFYDPLAFGSRLDFPVTEFTNVSIVSHSEIMNPTTAEQPAAADLAGSAAEQ